MTILHVFQDDKFFNDQAKLFSSIEWVKNLYVYYTPSKDYKFKFINNDEVVIENDKRKYRRLFSDKEIDVIYFHSLSVYKHFYSYFNCIDATKVVIAWFWGYDLYSRQKLLSPLIRLNLYKPLTSSYIRDRLNNRKLVENLYHFFLLPYRYALRKKVISRLDYCKTVLPNEYELLTNYKGFHAKPFFCCHGVDTCDLTTERAAGGSILVGNSATFTNNHIDVLDILENQGIEDRRLVLPLNYGDDSPDYASFIIERFGGLNLKPLLSFVPYHEYDRLIDSCSYAVFGHVRQQAVGNILMCLNKGIKVFLYSDSVAYRYFKSIGMAVFSIENDLNHSSLLTPLSMEEIASNNEVFRRHFVTKDGLLKKLNDELIMICNAVQTKHCNND